MKGLIISNGEIKNDKLLRDVARDSDYIICADGGADYIADTSIKPDLLIGDFDSIDKDTFRKMERDKVTIKKFPIKKDYTDTELAINILIEKGAEEIIFMGATGSRLDHSLANIHLLYKLYKMNIKGTIVDENNKIFIGYGDIVIEKEENTYVSIIPMWERGSIVTLKGFQYETDRKKFEFSSSYGISNRIVKDIGEIKIGSGECIIVISKD